MQKPIPRRTGFSLFGIGFAKSKNRQSRDGGIAVAGPSCLDFVHAPRMTPIRHNSTSWPNSLTRIQRRSLVVASPRHRDRFTDWDGAPVQCPYRKSSPSFFLLDFMNAAHQRSICTTPITGITIKSEHMQKRQDRIVASFFCRDARERTRRDQDRRTGPVNHRKTRRRNTADGSTV